MALLIASLSVLAAPAPAGAIGQPADTGAVVTTETWIVANRILDLTVQSPSTDNATRKVRLILPDGWSKTAERTWPSLYLLHGGIDDYTAWDTKSTLRTLSQGEDAIMVMPDTSWCSAYSNWWNNGSGGRPQWETWITTEVRQIMERNYRAGTTRGVVGNSMGGLGAMKFAANHNPMFKVAASFSGDVDTLRSWSGASGVSTPGLGCNPFGDYWKRVWGDPAIPAQRAMWVANNPYSQAHKLAGVSLFLGAGSASNDAIPMAATQHLATRLNELSIPVTTNFTSGGHDWTQWTSQLATAWPMLMAGLEEPPPAEVDLSVDKTASTSTATVGDGLSYEVAVGNAGPAVAEDVVVVDDVPAELTVDGAVVRSTDEPCDVDGQTVTCELGDLAVDDEAFVDIDVTAVAAGAEITNTATVSSSTPEVDDEVHANDSSATIAIADPPPVNTPPVAAAGDDQTVASSATVTLDGSDSTDADDDELTFSWAQTAGEGVSLSDPSSATPTFVAPVGPATLTFDLTVSDGIDTTTDSVTVTVEAPDTVNVTGTVTSSVDPAGAQVYAIPTSATWPVAGAPVVGSTPTSGTYEFDALPDGDYSFVVIPAGSHRLFARWVGGDQIRADAGIYSVTAGELRTLPPTELEVGGGISGVVTDGEGDPVAGATVGIWGTGDLWLPRAQATTGADGTYATGALVDGEYRVQFIPPSGSGLTSRWHGGAPVRAAATPVAVSSPDVTAAVDGELVGSSSVSGVVTGPGGVPAEGVWVMAYAPTDAWVGSLWAYTGADGRYEFSGVPVGTYRVRFAPPSGSGLVGEWYDDASGRAAAADLAAAPGVALTGIDAELAASTSVSGVVTGPGGAPVAGMRVMAFTATDTWVGSVWADTGTDGRYEFRDLPVGTYRVRFAPASGSGLVGEWYDDTPHRGAAADLVVTPGTHITGIDGVLVATG